MGFYFYKRQQSHGRFTVVRKMSDTIAAISTPPGEGGIGIIRVSGDASLEIMKKIFIGAPDNVAPRHAYYGTVADIAGNDIDKAICIYMKAPHTYTCEDVVEFQAHGGIVSTRLILRAVLDAGARMAEPGEFTKLAFMNGRIDLTQAEAVIDLIKAKSELPHDIAVNQLEGRLGEEVREIRSSLIDTLAQMAVNIDFPDEDIEQVSYDNFVEDLTLQAGRIDKLIRTADTGKIAREGVKAAIVGRPNVGKSSLMNELLGEGRVIVTDVPGTTRDTIEETASISGVPLVLVDTAGIRDATDEIEKIGIVKSKREIEAADLVILVIDGSQPLESEDLEIIEAVRDRKLLVVINKEDLGEVVSKEDVQRILPQADIIKTSLKKRCNGTDPVTAKLGQVIAGGSVRSENGNIVTNERHLASLKSAEKSLLSAKELLERNEPLEIVEIDAHSASDSLGEIIGEAAGDEILDAVFSKFCLGK